MTLLALLPHLLAAGLVAVAAGGSLRLPRWAGFKQPASRLGHYWHTIRWQWLCVALLVVAVPPLEIIYRTARPYEHPALWFIVLGNIILGMYAPIVLAWISPRLRRGLLAYFGRVRAWLPQTPRERAVWVLLSVTTGVCEEVLFRGFALHYLTRGPLALSLPLGVVIACALFGVGHRYQGWRGALQTCGFGACMCALFVATGSLLLPIVVHILVNLRIALLPPRQAQLRPVIADLRPPAVS
ncbi:MAG TPA: CPBP family intramembrane glutamic endopeptidase [Herpetosiphonaceae bacterium]